jgi:acid stress-induced BolA-like protein IbaG/YrbA
MMNPDQIAELISQGMDNATVKVMSDDNTHFEAIIVSDAFDGMRPIARHQLVYKTLGELVGREIHALSLKTLTPAEAAKQA